MKNSTFIKIEVLLLLSMVGCLVWMYCLQHGESKPQIEVVVDTLYIEKMDTIPQEIAPEKVVGHVVVPFIPQPSEDDEQQQDTMAVVTYPVVQRVFSDDSTYTAYVSGAKVGEVSPKLDSIAIRQRIIERTITVTKKQPDRRWHVGVTAGYGVCMSDRTLQPFIGVGVQYILF